jgi:hypothetical protein
MPENQGGSRQDRPRRERSVRDESDDDRPIYTLADMEAAMRQEFEEGYRAGFHDGSIEAEYGR